MTNRTNFGIGLVNPKSLPIISYQDCHLDDIKVLNEDLIIGDKKIKTTSRFWNSFAGRYGVNLSVFNLWSHEEVFQRIKEKRNKNEHQFTLAVENDNKALAMSIDSETLVKMDRLSEFMESKKILNRASYNNGVVSLYLDPNRGITPTKIGGEGFEHNYMLNIPVDGFGNIHTYLALLRQICSNGAVAMTPSFKSTVNFSGKDSLWVINRLMATYDTASGHATLRERMHTAQNTYASLQEYMMLYKLLEKSNFANTFMDTVINVAGNPQKTWGFNNFDEVPERKRRLIGTKMRVYEAINIATEVATHFGIMPNQMFGYVGSLVSSNYDLEGSASAENVKFPDRYFA